MSPPTNWGPGVAALVAALAAGLVLLLQSRRGASLPSNEHTRQEELELQKQTLYGLIRDHQLAKDRMDEGAWTAERDRLEVQAARVLQQLEALTAPRPEGSPPPANKGPSFGDRNPKLVGALWGAGVMVFVGAIYLGIQDFANPRGEGGSMTGRGGGGMGGGGGEQQAAAEDAGPTPEQLAAIKVLQAKVDANPNDVAARNELGHALLHTGQVMECFKQAQEVVKIDSENAEARTHMAIVLLSTGDVSMAGKTLDKVIEKNEFGEALAYRGALYFQAGDRANAVTYLERSITADPRLAEAVGEMLDAAKSGQSMGAPSAPAAPASGGGPAMPEGPPSADDITGTITVAASAQAKAVPGATMFLFARAPGVDRGPPIWVKKIPVTSFPAEFRIGPGTAMMGGAAPAEVVISARIDADGNAMTRSGDDVEGKSATLKPGTTGVTITIGG